MQVEQVVRDLDLMEEQIRKAVVLTHTTKTKLPPELLKQIYIIKGMCWGIRRRWVDELKGEDYTKARKAMEDK